MHNRIENATRELRAAIEENPDHVYSDAFRETVDCLTLLADKIIPDHRYLTKRHIASLQDISYQAVVADRNRFRRPSTSICSTCNGRTVVPVPTDLPMEKVETCPTCDGTGK